MGVLVELGLSVEGERGGDFTHLVAMTPWTCISLFIRRTAILPSLLNLGGVWVCFSTSSLISPRAFSNRTLLRMSLGPFAASSASHAEMTSNFDVLLAGSSLAVRANAKLWGRLTSVD